MPVGKHERTQADRLIGLPSAAHAHQFALRNQGFSNNRGNACNAQPRNGHGGNGRGVVRAERTFGKNHAGAVKQPLVLVCVLAVDNQLVLTECIGVFRYAVLLQIGGAGIKASVQHAQLAHDQCV